MIINYNAKYDGQIKDLLVDLQNYLVDIVKELILKFLFQIKKD